jgi:hypothetical protein
MSKRARRRGARIKVDDAAQVVSAVRLWANLPQPGDPVAEQIQAIAAFMAPRWDESPVALRVDAEFAGALMNSNTDVELVPDWLDRFPFNAVTYSLVEPLPLNDGHQVCRYGGMLVTGANRVVLSSKTSYTTYVNIPGAQGARCLWVYTVDGCPRPQLQTVTFRLRGDPLADTTLAGLIEAQIYAANEAGQSAGEELPTLIPLSLSLLLYTAVTDPEIDWPPAEHIARPQQLRDSRIGNLGWRVGSALRLARRQPPTPASSDGEIALRGGWRLPPHIRKAHWHRVRVAERDDRGQVIGDRSGVEGVDWHYELRWWPPTAINADRGIAPAVREFGTGLL